MSAKVSRIVLVLGAVLLTVLLYFLPKVSKENKFANAANTAAKKAVNLNANLNLYESMASKNLSPELMSLYTKYQSANAFDSLVTFWDKLKRPELAAHFFEKKAVAENTAETWFKAGNRYYYSNEFVKDNTQSPLLYGSAMRCYTNGLKLEPNNIDGRIMLASCYVEASDNPMDGVSRLKEIEKTDSNNVKLQLTFAFLSIKSGQLDKAIARFNKVVAIDSNYIEAYLHLADAYEQLGNKEKTVEVLTKYANKTTDVTAQIEIKKYIEQLKK